MFGRRRISYGSDDSDKERSVRWYLDWLFKDHTTRCSALEEAVTEDFVVTDDRFVVQTLRDAYEDLRQSQDPAVRYYISTLNYLPEGSQRRNRDAVPLIEWLNRNQTNGMVVTPAGTCLGFVEKYPDGTWGITPSEDGLVRVTETARALRDAKAYLVNRLTRQVAVNANGQSKQLRTISNMDFFLPSRAWNAGTDLAFDTYDVEFWDANHGLDTGEEVSMELQSDTYPKLVSVLRGTVTAVAGQKVSIKGAESSKSKYPSPRFRAHPYLHLQPCAAAAQEDAAHGGDVVVVAAHANPDVPLAGQASVRWIEADPAEPR